MAFETQRLYYGDNLEVLRNYDYFPSESVDLIYLDPPFNSARNYNVLFRDESGLDSAAQMEAFGDTWHWGRPAEDTYLTLVHDGSRSVADVITALRSLVGTNQMMAYLVMMAARLVELHRVLKPTGSLYLHCDPTASHYLKFILDAIFGTDNFRNEIIWKRTSAHNDARKKFGNVSDSIFFYTKSDEYTFNHQYAEHTEAYTDKFYRFTDENGRVYRIDNIASPNPRPNLIYDYKGYKPPVKGWRYSLETMQRLDSEGRLIFPKSPEGRIQVKRFLDEMQGSVLGNIWDDIKPLQANSKERTGYPTQKPLALLERIIAASSNPGDIMLDPFSGCGTAVTAAHKLGRRWVGIDITHLAITVMKHQLDQQLGIKVGADYQVVGEPVDVGGAQALALQDRHQFEWWAISLVGARPSGGEASAPAPGGRAKGKKGADKGIDGFIPFIEKNGKLARVIVSVKSGDNIGAAMVRDLVGTLDREKSPMGILILLNSPTKPMLTEAAAAGYYESELWKRKYPRLQLMTIADLLSGRQPELPQTHNPFSDMERVDKHAPQDKMDKLL